MLIYLNYYSSTARLTGKRPIKCAFLEQFCLIHASQIDQHKTPTLIVPKQLLFDNHPAIGM